MATDFNQQHMIVKKLVRTPFQHQWQFRLEIEDQPDEFEIFIKDVSYGPVEIEYKQIQTGAKQIQLPVQAMPVSVSVTVRDHDDERVFKWFSDWASKVVNKDGTVNPPFLAGSPWVKKLRKYTLIHSGNSFQEKLSETYHVAPVQMGDITQSYEEHGFKTFPLTMIQFRS